MKEGLLNIRKCLDGSQPRDYVGAVAALDHLLSQCSAWTDAEKEKPEPRKKVLVCGKYDNGKRWRTTAAWYPKGTLDASMWDDPPEDWWDNETDTCTNPEDGWQEEPIEGEMVYELKGVTHWMPLPEMPLTPRTA